MRLILGLAALVLACQPQPATAPSPARCAPSVPETAQHPIAVRTADLAGDYQLIQTPTQPAGDTVRSARLHLAQPDSAARVSATGRPVGLVGRLEPSGRTDVVLDGEPLKVESNEAGSPAEYFMITAVAPEGFWGWWRVRQGWTITRDPHNRRVVPDRAGYFCALRLNPVEPR